MDDKNHEALRIRTAAEVGQIFRLSPKTIYALLKSGRVRGLVRVGRSVRVDLDQFEASIRERQA